MIWRLRNNIRRSRTMLNKGFTVVELVVVMTLTLLFSGLVIGFALDYWGSVASLQNSNDTLVTRQNAGDILRDQLSRASGLIIQNSIADANAEVSDPSDVSGTHWLVLHATPQTVTMPAAGNYTPVFYFTSPSVDSNRLRIMNGSLPYYDEFVLYLNGSKKQLLLRTLTNPAATGNRLLTTCPASAATTSCPADRVVAQDVYSVEVNYFSLSGNQIDYTAIVDTDTGQYIGPDFPSVEVAEVTINLKKRATIKGTADTTNSTIIRVALRNG